MTKKFVYSLLGIICLVAGVYIFSPSKNSNDFFGKECPFCNRSILDYQKFYEDDLVLALYTYKPIMPGHCLVIPKRHVERFEQLTDAEAAQICTVIKKVNQAATKAFGTSSYLLLQKNGQEVGQTVPHVHFHYIPRRAGDDSSLKFIFKMYVANLQKPISPADMQQATEKLKAAME